MKYTNIYYFYTISQIGGIETFFYQLAKKYKDIDLTIVYRYADPLQLERLKKYVRCVQYTGQKFECERAFFNFNTDIIDNVDAKDYVLVIHGDYKAMMTQGQISEVPHHPKINKWVAVSKRAQEAYSEITGKPVILSYNPFELEKPKKVLNLISATRLTREKGKHRMIQLAEALDKAGIQYIWTVFTNDTNAIDNPNIVYMKPRLDITNFIANADYLVQLSDNEGYCYSVVEALSMGTPVIVTPCPVFEELGLKDAENCYIYPFDMQKINVKKLLTIPKFTYMPPKDNWSNLLINKPSSYEEEKNTTYLVRATSEYVNRRMKDNQLGKIPEAGCEWEVNLDRMLELTGGNKYNAVFVKVVKKIVKKS